MNNHSIIKEYMP